MSRPLIEENGARYRWMVASRAIAAMIGGFFLTSLATAVLSLLLPRISDTPRAEAVLISTLLSFVLWTCVVLWIFTTRSAKRAWWGIALPSAILGVVFYALH